MKTAAMVIAAGLLVSCSSAVPTETPGVERMGATVLRYQGPEIEAVLGYRYAAANLGEDWLLLDLATTGAGGKSVEISRDKVFVRTPAGETVPLASQESFGQAYASLTSTINRAAIAADPLDYWAGRQECALQFLVAPGEGIAQLSSWVDNRRVCSGRLFFEPPQGVQAGHYVFGIDLEESKVRIPFELKAD